MFFQTYLKEFAFGNAVYTDLWRHLQMVGAPLQKIPVWWSMSEGQCLNIFVLFLAQAVNQTGTVLPDTLENIMNTWVLQMGFPVVTINTTTGEVRQQHFLLDPDSNVTTPSDYK